MLLILVQFQGAITLRNLQPTTYNVSFNTMDEACLRQALDDGPSETLDVFSLGFSASRILVFMCFYLISDLRSRISMFYSLGFSSLRSFSDSRFSMFFLGFSFLIISLSTLYQRPASRLRCTWGHLKDCMSIDLPEVRWL